GQHQQAVALERAEVGAERAHQAVLQRGVEGVAVGAGELGVDDAPVARARRGLAQADRRGGVVGIVGIEGEAGVARRRHVVDHAVAVLVGGLGDHAHVVGLGDLHLDGARVDVGVAVVAVAVGDREAIAVLVGVGIGLTAVAGNPGVGRDRQIELGLLAVVVAAGIAVSVGAGVTRAPGCGVRLGSTALRSEE